MAFVKEDYMPLRQSLSADDSDLETINGESRASSAVARSQRLSIFTVLLSVTVAALLALIVVESLYLARLQRHQFSPST